METTVTGLFPDADAARRAQQELEREGFAPEAITLLTRDSPNLHQMLGEETSDAVRGAAVGGAVASFGMAIAGIALALPPLSVFDMHWAWCAVVGAMAGGVAGAVIGLLIGSGTGHQVQQEYEHLIEGGGQLVAVNTDGGHASRAHGVLQRSGGSLLSTSVHAKVHVGQTA